MNDKQIAIVNKTRRKIINLFDRPTLDRLSGMPKPWLADKATVLMAAMVRWNADEINEAFSDLMKRANQ